MKLPSIRTLRKYHRIAGVGEIARRYFAMNGFDGVLTILGVLVGSYFGGIRSNGAIVTLGISTSFAMGLSGFYGAYLTERAERKRALAELEESTLSSLEDTDISDASTYATILVAFVTGASPFVTAVVALSPFFLGSVLSVETAFYASFILAFAELFGLGAFLGFVSRSMVIVSGAKMVAAGALCVVVGYILRGTVL